MAKIRNEELVVLNGEVLPERTVLSAVPMDGGTTGCGAQTITQSGGVSGSVLGLAGTNNQCGLNNTGAANGLGLLSGIISL